MRGRKTLLLSYCLLLACSGIFAQKKIRFGHYDFREGLSNQVVNCIFQDHLGFLWIGTDFGLNRFDGISFKSWYNDPSRKNSLVHNKVLSITEDRNHRIWIGTQEGISCLDPFTGSFTNYSESGQGIYHFTKKYCHVFTDSSNNIWIGHSQGVDIMDVERSSISEIRLVLQAPGRKMNNYVKDFLEDATHVWAATSHGLYRFDKKKFSYRHFLLPRKGDSTGIYNALTGISVDKDGTIWCGSWASGLIWWDPVSEQLRRKYITIPDHGEIDYAMDVLLVREKGTSWLYTGTHYGLAKVQPNEFVRNDRYIPHSYEPDRNDPHSISNDIRCFLADRSGNVWIGSSKGLYKIDPNAAAFQAFTYASQFDNTAEPYSVIRKSDDLYWIQTGRKIFLFDRRNEQFRLPPYQTYQSGVYDITEAGGYYWLTGNSGLVQMNRDMQPVRVYDTVTSPGLRTQIMRLIYPDRQGNLWIGTRRQGILRFNIRAKRFRQKFHNAGEKINLRGWDIDAIFQDHENNMWIGGSAGLYRYNPLKDEATRFTLCKAAEKNGDCDGVLCLFQAADKKLYIGTRLGFYYFDFTKGKIFSIPLHYPGISQYILRITEDAQRRLWLVTNNGLVCYDPHTQKARLYSLKSGLPDNNLTMLYNTGSELMSGFRGNLLLIDPSQLYENTIVPTPVFSSIYINDSTTINPLENDIPSLKHNYSIAFEFVSLNYANTAQNQYAYKLEGLDKEWKAIGNSRTLRFSNLPAGSYTLLVKGAGSENGLNGEPAQFTFVVRPVFWKTWWFIGLLVSATGSAAWFFYRYRLKQAIRLERLRTRIATDLHDDIGATLSSIAMYSEAVKKQVSEKLPHLETVLDKMGENSRNMVSTMSDIVWTINPDNDAGQKLVDRLEAHAKDLTGVQNVQLYFHADHEINHLVLSLEHRKNIYLIFKEVLNNAMKYSGAKHLWLSMVIRDRQLQLIIKDDGTGFDPSQEFPGNGLKNIRARAHEMQGTIDIHSGPGEGTVITLSCKIT